MGKLTDYMSEDDVEIVLKHVELDDNQQITFEAFTAMMKSNPMDQQPSSS